MNMANEEHLAILKQGVEVWNRWRKEHPSIEPVLSGADLRHAYLREADLSGVNLTRADLRHTYLRDADLRGADLRVAGFIRVYDKLLLVLSEHSMSSEWVKTEIYHARQDEIRRNKRKLFPIGLVAFDAIRHWEAFDADTGKDMGREVREYFIPDFSSWKDYDSYTKAFDRLLHDLKQ